jgi:hypothetical protein
MKVRSPRQIPGKGVITLTERTPKGDKTNTIIEIEVTPKMIEAGETELSYYGDDGDSSKTTVLAIFEAMLKASPRSFKVSSRKGIL